VLTAKAEGARARAATKDVVEKDFIVCVPGTEMHDFF
jgi:hypothetical protein